MEKMVNIFRTLIKITLVILIVFLVNVEHISAQNVDTYKKNTAYITYGNIVFSSQISISYERMIFEKNKRRTNVKANYGNYLSNNADYDTNAKVYENFLSLSAVQLIGWLELNGGVAFAQYKLADGSDPEPNIDYSEIKQSLKFYGNIGIRYTKDKFLFRAGVGNLELLYIGIGVNFL